MDKTIIYKNNFTHLLLTEEHNIINRQIEQYRNDTTNSRVKFINFGSAYEQKIKKIFNKYAILNSHLDKLDRIRLIFKTKEFIAVYKKIGLNSVDFYQYTYESYIVSLITTLDLCAKLGKEVYNLKIRERDCNWYKFAFYPKLLNSNSSKYINDFAKYLNTQRTNRHIIIHKGDFKSEEIESLDSTIFDTNLLQLSDVTANWFKSRHRQELNKMNRKMNNQLKKAIEYIGKFLESMDEQMQQIINK